MPNNTLSDREVERIAKVVLAYERRVKKPFEKRDPPLVDDPGKSSAIIEYTIDSLELQESGPYTGLIAAQVTIRGCICGKGATLINTTAEVIDHSGCIFDEEDMTDYTGWAAVDMEYLSLDAAAEDGELTPCHYAAINRCCAPDSGTYVDAVEE